MQTKQEYHPDWRSAQEIAEWLGVTVNTLFKWRTSKGLNWSNLEGKTVMYDKKQINELQVLDDLLEKIKSGSLNVAELSKATQVPAWKMYKWKVRGLKDVSFSDGLKLLRWLGLDICPKDQINLVAPEPGPEASLKQLLKAKRELLGVVDKIEKRIDDQLSEGKDNLTGGNDMSRKKKDNQSKKDKSGRV